jgi:hypothetical protein
MLPILLLFFEKKLEKWSLVFADCRSVDGEADLVAVVLREEEAEEAVLREEAGLGGARII